MASRTGDLWSREKPDGEEASTSEREHRLAGVVQRVTFHRPDNGYTVLRIRPDRGYGDPEPGAGGELFPVVTAVGPTLEPPEGARVLLEGAWDTHPTHGRQFAFDWLQVRPPLDSEGLVRYLASKAFEGIGETLARRIVDKLGTRCLAIIRDEPERLESIRGLRASVREKLAIRVAEEEAAHRSQAYLIGLGLGPQQAHSVVKKLGLQTEELVSKDPWILTKTVDGIGFRTADRLAASLGIELDSHERCRAGLLQVLRDASGDGHTLLAEGSLYERALELLGGELPPERLTEALERLAAGEEVRLDDGALGTAGDGETPRRRCYLPALFHCETELARSLAGLLSAPPTRALANERDLAAAEREALIELHPLQREAVLGLTSKPLGLLTGGPGVGKTTIVRLVVELAERAGLSVRLASPTGRAAKRLAEATGRRASTLHRLLEWDAERTGFAHHDGRPLKTDLLIVDEISMLDVVLAYHLFRAVKPPTRLVLVGDPDQLPSVGPGNVLSDLLNSASVPTWRLTAIFRQAEGSRIVANAHRILAGEMPVLPEREGPLSDFYVFPAEGEDATAERLVEVVTRRIPERFGLRWDEDVQVLAPMYRGACGVDALNERLREALGAGGREVSFRGRVWRVGDRVIHTRNDYEKQVFNGDLGRITAVHPDGGLMVQYPEQDVFYAPQEFSDLQAAFAITVHRSQGGEFPAVVMPLVTQHWMMLQRHLLYTAVTRARRLCVLVGSTRALRRAIENTDQSRRESALAARLAELCDSPHSETPGS